MTCGGDCPAFVAKWDAWWTDQTRHPVAMLNTCPDYLAACARKNTRRDVAHARRLYTFRRFDRNDHLEQLHDVDTSIPERQGRPMTASYVQPKEPSTPWRLCGTRHRDEWHGAFDGDTLVAYGQVIVVDELGIFNRRIGNHARDADAGLIAYLAEALHPQVRWLNYLDIRSGQPGLQDFKRRMGFREVVIA